MDVGGKAGAIKLVSDGNAFGGGFDNDGVEYVNGGILWSIVVGRLLYSTPLHTNTSKYNTQLST
jgi:hypothetical protein